MTVFVILSYAFEHFDSETCYFIYVEIYSKRKFPTKQISFLNNSKNKTKLKITAFIEVAYITNIVLKTYQETFIQINVPRNDPAGPMSQLGSASCT